MSIKPIIEDTYSEVFEGIYSQVIITADDKQTLTKAVEDVTATPSLVIGRLEGGIEKWLDEDQTPDNRKGALIQFWGGINPKTHFSKSLKKFEIELSYRIRQDVLVKPFTAIFNALLKSEGKIDMMERVGHCGDGYEWIEKRYDRKVIVVPTLVPDFIIEESIGYAHGIMGANFWIMCKTKKALKESGERALKAIYSLDGVITPFDICSAGSKPGTKYPWIGPTTNHSYCPSLKKKLGTESKVPDEINYIPEIVINGVSLASVKLAMKVGIKAALDVDDVIKISSANYGGKLGNYKIHLRELFK